MADYWKDFTDTGSIENYLAYKEHENSENKKDEDEEDGD
ncbi:YqzL family protein [Candidatus Epulonipiscium viviparus]|nr:YqzL family protein [Candidatus Epulopiscium viviparus]